MKRNKIVVFLLFCIGFLRMATAQNPELIPYRKGELWGYSKPDKQLVIQPKWEETTFFTGELAQVKNNGSWGVINKSGKELTPFQYHYISEEVNGYVIGVKADNSGSDIINKTGIVKSYNRDKYKSLGLLKGGLILARDQNRKFGLINLREETILPFEYENIKQLDNGYLITELELEFELKSKIIKLDPRLYYNIREPEHEIDTENKVIYILVTKEEKKQMEAYGYMSGQKKELEFFGFFDPKGNVVLEPKYAAFKNLENGLFLVGNEGELGLTNSEGKFITEQKYDGIMGYQEGMTAFSLKGKWGYLNEKGEEVIPAKYEKAHWFFSEYGMVKKSTGWGFVDKQGNEVGSFEYTSVRPFSEGLAAVEKDYLWGYINEKGEEVIPRVYKREQFPFTNGIAILTKEVANQRGQYFGIINKQGETIVPFRMHEIKEFKEGMARVMLRAPQGNEKFYGFVDSTGKQVIPIKYQQVGEFQNGQVYVRENRQMPGLYLNANGEEVEPVLEKRKTLFEAGEEMGNGYVKLFKRGVYGYMSKDKVKYYEN